MLILLPPLAVLTLLRHLSSLAWSRYISFQFSISLIVHSLLFHHFEKSFFYIPFFYYSVFAQLSNLLAFAVVFWFDFDHFAHVQ